MYLLAPWLANALEMIVLPSAGDTLCDSSGTDTLRRKAAEEDNVVLLSDDVLERLWHDAGLSCVWFLVADRYARPNGDNAATIWRRVESVAWMCGDQVVGRAWKRDRSAQEVQNGSRLNSRKRVTREAAGRYPGSFSW